MVRFRKLRLAVAVLTVTSLTLLVRDLNYITKGYTFQILEPDVTFNSKEWQQTPLATAKIEHKWIREATNRNSTMTKLPNRMTQLDESGKYKFYKSQDGHDDKEETICLATHCTADKLHWLAQQTNMWNGSMSIAVFSPEADLWVVKVMVDFMKKCLPNMKQKASFHYVHPVDDPLNESAVIEYINISKSYSCSDTKKLNLYLYSLLNKTEEERLIYPQNLMRNIARKACQSAYTLSVDIDMIARKNMARDLDIFLRERVVCTMCTFIVPVYEIATSVPFPPKSKTTLLKLVRNKKARFFHKISYLRNQANSKLSKWESLEEKTSQINVAYDVLTYQEFWEPILILHSSAPEFDERFVGYGCTRNSQVLLLAIKNYTFSILDNAFLSHRGFSEKHVVHPQFRQKEMNSNTKLYKIIKSQILEEHHLKKIRYKLKKANFTP